MSQIFGSFLAILSYTNRNLYASPKPHSKTAVEDSAPADPAP
jgi:hypothetical protein